MKKSARTAKRIKIFAACAILVLAIASAIFISAMAGKNLQNQRAESIKDAVLRAAFQCYSVEGVYPDRLDYLEKAYGVMINHDEYRVTYDCYASNMPPKVQVLNR